MVKFAILAFAAPLLATTLAQNATIRYMPFGDSITEIICWRSKLWERLQTAGYTDVNFVGSGKRENPSGCKDSKYDPDNEGHSGYLATDIASKKQLVDWLKKNPADVITMHLGTNDVNRGKSTEQIIAAFTTLVEQMRDANPRMKIIVAQIIPLPMADAKTKALNAAIPAWASSKNSTTSPIWVVDQYTGFPSTDLRDGIHPNDAGDVLMTNVWYPAITRALDLQRVGAKREVEFTA